MGYTARKGGPFADHGWHGPKPSAMFVTGLSSGLCSMQGGNVFGCFIGFLLLLAKNAIKIKYWHFITFME